MWIVSDASDRRRFRPRSHVVRPLPVLPFRDDDASNATKKGHLKWRRGKKWENPFAVVGIGNLEISTD